METGDVSGAVLAGGESRRFGQDKAHALLGGKPLIGHVLEPLRGLFQDLLIVTNRPSDFLAYDAVLVSDIVPGAGALGGLLTALVHAQHDRCFVVACDMPFLQRPAVLRMIEQSTGCDAVVPEVRGELQPLHAVYTKRCIPPIERSLRRKAYRILDFYPQVTVRYLDDRFWTPEELGGAIFSNINTPDAYRDAQRRIDRDPPRNKNEERRKR